MRPTLFFLAGFALGWLWMIWRQRRKWKTISGIRIVGTQYGPGSHGEIIVEEPFNDGIEFKP